MEKILTLLRLLAGDPEVCTATEFGAPGDRWAGGHALLLKRPVEPDDMGVAHRTLPLGSAVVVQSVATSKLAIGRVIDRGPYGAMVDGQWAIKLRRTDPGTWRACLDLTPRMARAIGHNGFARVRVWSLPWRN